MTAPQASAWAATAGEQPAVASVNTWLRQMRPPDLDAVTAIEASVYAHPWTRGNFADALTAGYVAELLLGANAQILGYVLGLYGHEETHLLNLTVAPSVQRQGHGRALLARLRELARLRGDRQLWLEVRQSNAPAQSLYRQAGFEQIGLRRGYYPAGARGREDALVMRLNLSGRGHGLD